MFTAEVIAGLGSEAIIVQADVKDFDACQALGEEAINKYGQIDFLVNNAGINRDITFSRMSQEEWQEGSTVLFRILFDGRLSRCDGGSSQSLWSSQ